MALVRGVGGCTAAALLSDGGPVGAVFRISLACVCVLDLPARGCGV